MTKLHRKKYTYQEVNMKGIQIAKRIKKALLRHVATQATGFLIGTP